MPGSAPVPWARALVALLVCLAVTLLCVDTAAGAETGGAGSNRDLVINVGGTGASPASASPTSHGSSAAPSKTSSASKPTSSGSSNGQPGRIVMKTPPQAVESPLFEIASKVKLQWSYDPNMKQPPSKITIRGQMPDGFHEPGTNKALYWYIAQNVSAADNAYTWDTVTESPPGYTLREGTGYRLYIIDGDIGWENSTRVNPGKLFQFMLPFSMYNSRYAQTNDGVPKNYNPNAAAHAASSAGAIAVAGMAALAAALLI